jgi:hypothetical protein
VTVDRPPAGSLVRTWAILLAFLAALLLVLGAVAHFTGLLARPLHATHPTEARP